METVSVIVDTAALAVHLECAPGYVRLLVHHGIIETVGKQRVKRCGRLSNTYDLDAVDAAITAAVDAGTVVLDQGRVRVRK